MKVKQAINEVIANVEQLEDRQHFDATIAHLEELFNSFWAYSQFLTPAIYDKANELQNLISTHTEKSIPPQVLMGLKRKIVFFIGIFSRLIKDTPIADLEIVSKSELRQAMRPFRLLVVCVANANRSPALEQAIQFIKTQIGLEKLEVRSCGVWNLMNLPQSDRKRLPVIEKIGSPMSGKGLPITKELCDWANLIITAAPYVSDSIRNAFPSAKGKVMTIKRFLGVSANSLYAFYIDDPHFSIQKEMALDEWLTAKKGTVPEFLKKVKEEIATGLRKSFLYRGKYAEESTRAWTISSRELIRIGFSVVEKLIQDNYLLSKPELKSHLLFSLSNLRARIL